MQMGTQTTVCAITDKKAFQIPRRDTLFYKSKTRNIDRPVFVTAYNPSLPNLNNVIKKYHPILTATEHCQEAFKDTPLLAYRHPKNLRDFLMKAKLKQSPPNITNLPRKVTHCNDGCCCTCIFIAHATSSYTFHNTGKQKKSYKICPALPIIWFT